MQNPAESVALPDSLRKLLTLVLTVSAALLYAIVLGVAIVRTLREPSPVFSEGMVRTAQLLSGLVGSVVAAGFAQSKGGPYSVGGVPASGGAMGQAASLAERLGTRARAKFGGLADMLCVPTTPQPAPRRTMPVEDAPAEQPPADGGEPASSTQGLPFGVWVALLYFVVYFVVGASALLLFLFKSTVPNLVADSAWVWLGTVSSSGYAFFALGAPSR
jgi:hypothetical protein